LTSTGQELFSAVRQKAGYSKHENGAGHCLQSAAGVDEYRPRPGIRRQRSERSTFLSLWQEDWLLCR